MVQHIRGSQFIITWGPGAILEGPSGPRLIPLPDIGLFYGSINPDEFEISDERMSEGLLGGSKIFRLPSNAELGKEDRAIYRTKIFPEWWICSDHWKLFRYHDGCPECGRRSDRGRGKHDAVRFVLACSKGHLDDVNWHYAVHIKTGGNCRSGALPRYYNWAAGGGSLKEIKIGCPKCGAEVTVGELYSKPDWRCSGRYPEREPIDSEPIRHGCSRNAIMILRQASNIRVPEIMSLFSVRLYTRLHNLLSMREVKAVLLSLEMGPGIPDSPEEFREVLLRFVENGVIREDVALNILSHPWEEIRRAIDDVLKSKRITGYDNLIRDEFDAFWEASVSGAPPVRGPPPKSEIVFEVPREKIRTFTGPHGLKFRVSPVTRLRTILVQTGYRRYVQRGAREAELDAEIVPVHFYDGEIRWYPGVELLGEGIFIRLDGDGFLQETGGESWNQWNSVFESPRGYRENVFTRGGEELHPVFVWWHTLSHLLIRILSVDSGYSSTAIRERIYLRRTENGFRGGIVLYTVQPGEGTMGGLVSQVENFDRILSRVAQMVINCANDPLCFNHKFRNGRVTGSACYACLLISETSCEHRNMWLDRNVIIEVMP